ncbi:MAG: tripartite tricarboxylate transporter permease [Saprospiraceae bacterium]|nr:tripartite tricarboxylate transporter permease [Saprospiraceae bacterium]
MMEFFTWQSLLALVLGALYGSLFGAIPGLTATLAVALFIPVAFFLDPIVALPAIISISAVAIYAGDVGSIVAKIPGTPASAAYLEELSRVAKRKGPFYGLGLCAMSSATGGIIGTLLLIALATTMASIAKNFSSFEYFWIAILGLTAGVFATGGSTLKAVVSLLLGILFSTVGIDPTLGFPRFEFGQPDLLSGLNYIVAMIGLFGFSEVLEHVYRRAKGTDALSVSDDSPGRMFFSLPWIPIIKRKWMVLRSSLLGVLVGFLPGAGADIGSWVSSSVEKMTHRSEGDAEDEVIVIAGTSSNNAAVASAWVPSLALGLPGDTITAIVLGVFLMKGITPGPLLFEQQPELIWSLYLTFLLANLIMLPVFGYLTARMASWLIRIPLDILLSAIAGVCVVGAYVINNSSFDILIMTFMGIIAFGLRRGGFPLAQVVLGMVLGPILEQNFMVSAIKSRWDIMSFFDRPIALVLMALTIVIIMVGIRTQRLRKSTD